MGAAPAPIAPAPEQVASVKKIEAKPTSDEGASSTSAPAAPKAASKPADPDGAGKFHAIA